MKLSAGTFTEQVVDVLANDRRGVVYAEHQFDRSGTRFRYRTLHLYDIRDGKPASFREFPEDQAIFDEAWG